MKRLATVIQAFVAVHIVGSAFACSPNPAYVPPTVRAEATRAENIVIAVITEFPFLEKSKTDTLSKLRDGKFYVLYSLKGHFKTGDIISVLDEPGPCELGFSSQNLSETTGGRYTLANSNTWVLFLAGKQPYKLWETRRSGPLNQFSTEEIRRLFTMKHAAANAQVQPNPSLERP
jgi:hypothetical protein